MSRWLTSPLITVLVASFVVYAALLLAPGDPAVQILGPRATAEQYAALRHSLGLDRPMPVQYGDWLWNALHGDFGSSLTYKQPVSALLGSRLAVTLELAAYAGVLIIVVGIAVGTLGGTARWARLPVTALTAAGIAVPSFVAAQTLVAVLAVRLGWFPVLAGDGGSFTATIRQLTLPAVALAIGWSAYVAQVTRASVAAESRSPHVEAARGRGLSAGAVLRRHILRNAAIPITTVSALAVAGLFASAVVVESAFGLGGLGSLLVQSVAAKDQNAVLAVSLILLVVFVVTTTTVDVLQAALDPRLRTRKQV
ncbi:peptide/nickel transport system permease protein [Actinoplanes lutulentus]|nr:ABC transporter permease [Actinoplanes lutulentus]MBB2946293.1 peptide/nickel transport system permease protein [Actinoplanes lutulentus]